MRTLVTGGAGFIGSAIAQALLENGHEVRVFDNFVTGSKSRVPLEAELVEGDLRNRDELDKAMSGVEVVFHQAALRSVPKSVDNPTMFNECNVTGTLNLLLAAQGAGVRRVVYASSSSVYGERDSINLEDMTPQPASPYAASKLAGEYYCRVWTRLHGLSTISLRYFNVFGPGQPAESQYAAVFPAFISSLRQGRAPELHWDGEQSRDFSYIDDVVRANLLAASAEPAADGAVLNIGGGNPRTVNEVLRAVSDEIGTWIEPVKLPRRQGDVRRTHADISLAQQVIGWQPTSDWNMGVKATVQWFGQEPS